MSSIDKKAKKILLSAFWKSGWIDNAGAHLLSLDDFLYAKQHDLMFDPLTITYDELIKKLLA